jgi:Fe-S-cluster containining protein
MEVNRVGHCVNCGACCRLYNGSGYGHCKHYRTRKVKHCLIYSTRPSACRRFPRSPMDIQNKPECGYMFLDEHGRVIDPFMDKRVRLRLIQ